MSIKRLAMLVVGSTAMAAFTVVSAHAADTWVAIYWSQATYAYGYVTDAPTKEDAKRAANDKCVYNGGTDCKLAAVIQNGCVALARAPEGWAGGYGATIAEAEQHAIATNNGLGRIFISKCST